MIGDSGSSLSARAVSSFPISIGTSLALESIFDTTVLVYDESRPLPPKVDINQYQEAWFNLATLFRNLAAAVNGDVFRTSHPNDLADVLDQEIDVIQNLFQSEGKNVCKPVFYHCSYEKLHKKADGHHYSVRTDNTVSQKAYADLLMKTMKVIDSRTDQFLEFDSELTPKDQFSTLIMTHIPWDLLSYKRFRSLALLETHTGKLKNRYQWNTKYFPIPGKDMSILPFTKQLLKIFGDKVQIQPALAKLRNLVYDVAVKGQWTSMTGQEKINMDFNLYIKEPYVLEHLRSL